MAEPAWTPAAVREFQEALERAVANPGAIRVLPPGHPELVLADVEFPAEVRHLPDGTDEVNHVRIRVTAAHARVLPATVEGNLIDVIRSHWPAGEDGWHSPRKCADE